MLTRTIVRHASCAPTLPRKLSQRTLQLTGLLQGTLLRDHTFRFMRLGRLLERADMTSRVIEVGTAAILESENPAMPEIPLLWFNLLNSLSAKSAYQRSVGPILDANSVVNFVFCNQLFPRSIMNCLIRIEETIGTMNIPAGLPPRPCDEQSANSPRSKQNR